MTDSAPGDVQFLNTPARHGRDGAYGFRLAGLQLAPGLLVEAPARWAELELRVRAAAGPMPAPVLDGSRALLPLRTGGWIEYQREPALAVLRVEQPLPAAALAHPLLGIIAGVPAYWLGRESFHAGAFALDGAAWAVIADREAGKSSLIASLALTGVRVVCDDILVLDGTTALAGPRSVDLRGPAAGALGVGEPLGRIGDRDRWRVGLEPVEPELPLHGWIALRWGEAISVRALRGSERLRRITAARAMTLRAPDPAGLIELSALPVLELTRPPRWETMRPAIERLLDAARQA